MTLLKAKKFYWFKQGYLYRRRSSGMALSLAKQTYLAVSQTQTDPIMKHAALCIIPKYLSSSVTLDSYDL